MYPEKKYQSLPCVVKYDLFSTAKMPNQCPPAARPEDAVLPDTWTGTKNRAEHGRAVAPPDGKKDYPSQGDENQSHGTNLARCRSRRSARL